MKLVTARICGGPIWFDVEAVGVEMTWNITSTCWVAVVPPSSSNVIGFLEKCEVMVSQQSLELNCHSEPRNSSADDEDFFLVSHGGGECKCDARDCR
jgi:hypothetical protein